MHDLSKKNNSGHMQT